VLGIPKDRFYAEVNPTIKLGIRFLWGPRPYFDYPFNEQFSNQILPMAEEPWGYYCLDKWRIHPIAVTTDEALLPPAAGYHFENQPLVEYFERHLTGLGGSLVDAKVTAARRNGRGIEAIRLDSGEWRTADLFVDASGFRGELIHRELGVPYVSMRDHLFCDRAVVGGWERERDDPILPYTTAETMEAGWCWRIEHERVVNRGYVHSSAFIDADMAGAEFLARNPRVREDRLRVVPFEARHVRQAWVGNVVAIGNACGFVEPLEATNIQVICEHALRLAETLNAGAGGDDVPAEAYNDAVTAQWGTIRDFLALHYRFNTRLDTPFWRMAVRETRLGDLQPYVDRYRAIGPCLLPPGQLGMFGHDGCLALLLGMRVPWANGGIL
jgi:tryptophan halogenase